MRYPAFLKDGGTIGYAAPSFGCATEPYLSAFQSALELFAERGYKAQLGPNVYRMDGTGISASPQECGRELTEMYLSKDNDFLFSVGGGELMCETIENVDWEAVKAAAPKLFMGYSDNTNMEFLLTTMCDVAAIYGPCAPSFGQRPLHPALEDAYDLMTGKGFEREGRNGAFFLHGYDKYEIESLKSEEHPLAPYNPTELREIHAFVPSEKGGLRPAQDSEAVRFSGRLAGGCLDCLANLVGTKFDKVDEFNKKYARDGVIWFLEACDLNVFAIRRAVWNLKNAGWFDQAAGFLIGRPYNGMTPMFGLDEYRAVTEILAPLGKPILMDLDIGHLPPMMPLLSGSYADVSLSGQYLQLSQTLR